MLFIPAAAVRTTSINANEAESRPAARFDRLGMTGGPIEITDLPPATGPNPYPMTLGFEASLIGSAWLLNWIDPIYDVSTDWKTDWAVYFVLIGWSLWN